MVKSALWSSANRSYTLLLLWYLRCYIVPVISDTAVYFDRFGDCEKQVPFELAHEDYTLKHLGGGFVHETLVCNISFKAPSDYGVCLKFKDLEIDDCSMRIDIYKKSLWKTFDCVSTKPNEMCTPEQTVSVVVKKTKLNSNKGYQFEIEVEKSKRISNESVLIASIGVFVGIILGVVVIIALLGTTVVYCCCKQKRKRTVKDNAHQAEGQTLVEPTAPPLEIPGNPPHLYPHLSSCYNQELPPPYIMADAPPPPYEPLDQQIQSVDEDQTLPLKQ